MPGLVKSALVFPLDAVRTDGWLQGIAAEIPNFDALSELLGERLFAFSMILGVRITTLTVDQQRPESTIVDFMVEDGRVASPQRLTLHDFRKRIVLALLSEEHEAEPPHDEDDIEGVKEYIGIRYLLLAPLYGYVLEELVLAHGEARLAFWQYGELTSLELSAFQNRIRDHVAMELDGRAQDDEDAIDLAHVAVAEEAASRGDWQRVYDLLCSWPAPLAVFLRTPEGQALAVDVRALVAKGLGLFGTACVRRGEVMQGEDIFRLAVQFASHGPAAGEVFQRLGEAMLDDGRPGEAIAPFRRALHLGGSPQKAWPLLAKALLDRDKYVAAWVAVEEAKRAGVSEEATRATREAIEAALGPSLAAYKTHLSSLS